MTGQIAPGVWQVPTTRRARDNVFLVAGDAVFHRGGAPGQGPAALSQDPAWLSGRTG